MAIITPDSASHWYLPDGTPCHKVPYKDKKRAGELKNTTLTDARKMGLRPSVTNVMGILSKPMLTTWGREQVLLIAAANPRRSGEGKEDYVRRIEQMHWQQVEELRTIGHKTHAAAEQYALSKTFNQQDAAENPVPIDCMVDWFDRRVKSVQHAEKVVVSSKYAGTLDLVGELHNTDGAITIADYKTRRSGWKFSTVRSQWECSLYEEDRLQLAAYRGALCEQVGFPFDTPLIRCCSVILPSEGLTKNPGEPTSTAFEKTWTMDEMIQSKQSFDHLLDAWQSLKKYTI